MKNKKQKTHVKKGDYVQIITGTYKGKTGSIIKVLHKKQTVIVENFNLKQKHIQPQKEGDTGKIIQKESPIHISNVMLYSKKNKTASRYRYKITNNNIKQRILIKTGEVAI
uniref:Large ribosomal subunit protein uL24c n=1 Tax=Caulacanthus okamurae TaxID=152008 RepID=A0A6H1U9C4_9FLOR|nr:50S ribosomal protein L24 [Caulacanthus okamurae]QIZ74653.1 50S ribosomal protein L24 [Caulacanthus okamurae]